MRRPTLWAACVAHVTGLFLIEELQSPATLSNGISPEFPEELQCTDLGAAFPGLRLNGTTAVLDVHHDESVPGLALSCPCSCASPQCDVQDLCGLTFEFRALPAVKKLGFKCYNCLSVEAFEISGERRQQSFQLPPEEGYYGQDILVEAMNLKNISISGNGPQVGDIVFELRTDFPPEVCASLRPRHEHEDCPSLSTSCEGVGSVGNQQVNVWQHCPFTCNLCSMPDTTTGQEETTTLSPAPTYPPPSIETPGSLPMLDNPVEVRLGLPYCSDNVTGLWLDPEMVRLGPSGAQSNHLGAPDLALLPACTCWLEVGCEAVSSLTLTFPPLLPVRSVAFRCTSCSSVLAVDDSLQTAEHAEFGWLSYVRIDGHRVVSITISGAEPEVTDLAYEFGQLEDCSTEEENQVCMEMLEMRCDLPHSPAPDLALLKRDLCPVSCGACSPVTSTTNQSSTTHTSTSTATSTTTTTSSTSTTSTTSTTNSSTSSTTTSVSVTGTTATSTLRPNAEPVSEKEEVLLQELFAAFAADVNVTEVVTKSEVSIVLAKQISFPQDGDATSRAEVQVEGSPVAASIPASLVQEAGGSVVVLMEAAASIEGDLAKNLTNASDTTVLAVPLVSVKLWADGVLPVSGLQEPVLITMSAEPVPGVVCVFWNETEQRWSTSGLETINDANGLVCATTHLSIFSAILRQLECLNIQVLTAVGLTTASTAQWTDTPSAILLYGVMVFWLCILVYAWRRDMMHLEETDWTDANFIMKVPPTHRMPMGLEYCRMICRSLFGLCRNPARRTKVGLRYARSTDWSERLCLYIGLMGVHCVLAVRSGIAVSTLKRHMFNKRGWVQNDLAISSCPVLGARLQVLRSAVPQAFVDFFDLSFCAHFVLFLKALHPYAVRLCLEQSAAKQMKLKADVMLGALVIAGVFFGVTGSATSRRSPEDCADARMSLTRFGLIGVISVSCVSLPLSLLGHTWQRSFVDEYARGKNTREKQLMFWQIQDFCFWVGSACYTLFCCFFVALFIANLSESDQWKWLLTFAVIVVRIALVQPVLIALSLACITKWVKLRRPEFVRDGHPRLHFKLPKKAAHASEKVKELASRSVSVADLLMFWAKVPIAMPHFDSSLAITHDVVRHAIIPLSKNKEKPEESTSYATLIAEGNYRPPDFMVTHNWGNKFTHLIAAILSEAIGETTYETTSRQLELNHTAILQTEADKLLRRYWVCCFCVNQHASICNTPPPLDSMGVPIAPCTCGVPKHWSGPHCEMDKFDEMIGFLSVVVPAFSQVVAVDMHFTAFTRVWCIAELAEARKMDLQQFLIVHSEQAVQKSLPKIEQLDVRNAQASVPEDKDRVLEKIDDLDLFNHSVRQLLLDRNVGLLTRFLVDLHGQAGPHDALDAMTHIMVDTMIPGVIE